MNFKNKAYLQLHAAIFFWGFTGVLGKAISMDAPAIVWYRMFLSAMVIGLIITLKGKWQRIPMVDMKRLAFVGMLFAIHWLAFYISIKLSGASIAMVCLATASVFTAIFAPLIHKSRIQISELVIGSIALSGVMVIYLFQESPMNLSLGEEQNLQWGIILGVIAAILSAVFTVLNKPLATKYEFRNVVFWEMVFGFLILCIALPFYLPNVDWVQVVPQAWDFLWLACLVYFCTVLGQQFVVQSLQQLNPFTVTLSVNIEPIYGIILAFIIFREDQFLGWPFYLGVSIIFISLILQVAWNARVSKLSNAK